MHIGQSRGLVVSCGAQLREACLNVAFVVSAPIPLLIFLSTAPLFVD